VEAVAAVVELVVHVVPLKVPPDGQVYDVGLLYTEPLPQPLPEKHTLPQSRG
jgi:hypothetical protein